MKNVTVAGSIKEFNGSALKTPVKYEGTFTAYESHDEVLAANDLPSHDEVVKFRNDQRKANARQKAMSAALEVAGIEKPTLENDPQLRLKTIYNALVASGKNHDEARAIASVTLGIDWK